MIAAEMALEGIAADQSAVEASTAAEARRSPVALLSMTSRTIQRGADLRTAVLWNLLLGDPLSAWLLPHLPHALIAELRHDHRIPMVV